MLAQETPATGAMSLRHVRIAADPAWLYDLKRAIAARTRPLNSSAKCHLQIVHLIAEHPGERQRHTGRIVDSVDLAQDFRGYTIFSFGQTVCEIALNRFE